ESVEVTAVAFRKLDRLCVILGICAFLAGCGGGAGRPPETIPVKGMVKYQGKPVPKLSVAFIPEKGMLASGTTDAEGKFTLMTNKPGDGAMVGTYKVAISFVSDEIPEMQGLSDAAPKPSTSPIPKKYADPKTSGLTRAVVKNDQNDFTFDLTD